MIGDVKMTAQQLPDIDIDAVLEMLPAQTTLELTSQFLREHAIEHSASTWEQMINDRIRPALSSGKLLKLEFIKFAVEAEEHGNQHVFLFSAPDIQKIDDLFDSKSLAKRLEKLKDWPTLNVYSVAQNTKQQKIVEVRLDKIAGYSELVIKTVEPRKYKKNRQERELNGKFIVTHDLVEYRAVNVAKLNSRGQLEIRIFSHKHSTSYERDLERFWGTIDGLLRKWHFSEHSLLLLRDALWNDQYRKDMKGKMGVRNSQLLNINGNRLRVASGSLQGNLWDDRGLVDGVNKFSNGSTRPDCEFANVALLAEASGGKLQRDIGFTLKGSPNELIITSQVSRVEHEILMNFARQKIGGLS